MFDEPENQAANHRFPNSEDVEPQPDALEPVHELLVAASEQWRSRLPAADRLAAFARGLPFAPLARKGDDEVDEDAPPLSSEIRLVTPPSAQRRSRPLPALIAAVTIVALFAGVLVQLAQSRFLSGVQLPTTTATSSVRPGFTPVTGNWSMSSIAYESYIVVSMSAPNVLYRDGKRLQRSNDGGKTWHTISTPQVPGLGAQPTDGTVSIMVSTGDPNMIVARVETPVSNGFVQCPKNAALASMPIHGGILASGIPFCTEEFASRDAGAHWQPVQVPTGRSLDLSGAPFFSRYLLAQGNLLYGSIVQYDDANNPLGVRIMVSSDGMTWRYADKALRANVPYICDYRPIPASAILYAVTLSQPCSNGFNGPHQIWRSNDGGAHWSPIDSVTGVNVVILSESHEPATGMPILYVGYTDSTAKDSFKVHVVREELQSLIIAPTAGIPSGQEPIFRVFGTLGDGSIVEAYADHQATPNTPDTANAITVTLYAWRMGDSAWRRVSAPLTLVAYFDTSFVATPTNHLWVVSPVYGEAPAIRNVYSFAA